MDDDYDHADGMTAKAVARCLQRHGVPMETTRVVQCDDGVAIYAVEGDDAGEVMHVCATWQDVRDFLAY